ncbi:hypothetical protein ATANTOWER_028596, partial [Ataeniobius toweri]|nr:hypothetical protein [Ataeniobius toweri]
GVTGRCFYAAVAHQGAINLGFKRSGEPEGGISSLSHFSGRQFLLEILWVFVPPVNSCHVLRIKVIEASIVSAVSLHSASFLNPGFLEQYSPVSENHSPACPPSHRNTPLWKRIKKQRNTEPEKPGNTFPFNSTICQPQPS